MAYRVEFILKRSSLRDLFYPNLESSKLPDLTDEFNEAKEIGILLDYGFDFSVDGLEITTWFMFKDEESFNKKYKEILEGKTSFQINNDEYRLWCEENNIEWETKIIGEIA